MEEPSPKEKETVLKQLTAWVAEYWWSRRQTKELLAKVVIKAFDFGFSLGAKKAKEDTMAAVEKELAKWIKDLKRHKEGTNG